MMKIIVLIQAENILKIVSRFMEVDNNSDKQL